MLAEISGNQIGLGDWGRRYSLESVSRISIDERVPLECSTQIITTKRARREHIIRHLEDKLNQL